MPARKHSAREPNICRLCSENVLRALAVKHAAVEGPAPRWRWHAPGSSMVLLTPSARGRSTYRRARSGWATSMEAGCLWISFMLTACDLGGPRPAASESSSAAAVPAASPAQGAPPAVAAQPAAGNAAPGRCIQPLATPAPPLATPASRCPADPDGPLQMPVGQVHFTDAPAAPRVTVELALNDPARARGLMYRTQMDGDRGMLFSWGEDARRSFWMQNTCIPLDMLFIAGDGTVVGILEQVPTLNTLPREVPCPARHVLELNAGWARAHGVVPGQHVDLET
jgi:uncharacterized membrane protein (UPF0127 family)